MNNNFYVMDVETDGLWGKAVDVAILGKDGHVVYLGDDIYEALRSVENDKLRILVWHQWLPMWLQKNHEGLMGKFGGRLVVFMGAAWMVTDENSIAKITHMLTGHEHVGNAKQDALDLLDVYHHLAQLMT